MYCSKCGKELSVDSELCDSCGYKVIIDTREKKDLQDVNVSINLIDSDLIISIKKFLYSNVFITCILSSILGAIVFGYTYSLYAGTETKQLSYRALARESLEKNSYNRSWKFYKQYWNGNLSVQDLKDDFSRQDIIVASVVGAIIGGSISYIILYKKKSTSQQTSNTPKS